MATYLRHLAGDRPIDDAVVRTWARETARNSDWMRSLGADVQTVGEFTAEYPELPGSEAYGGYRVVASVTGERHTFEVLRSALASRGIEVSHQTPGRRLLSDSDGSVIGVEAGQDGHTLRVVARGGVVLATGGFQANEQMVRDYLNLVDPPLWGSHAATGDGHRMAMAVGANLWHMNNHMALTSVPDPNSQYAFYQSFEFHDGFISVTDDGTRFTDELPQLGHGQAYVHNRNELFPQHHMHILFDEKTRQAGPISLPRRLMGVGWLYLAEGRDWSDDNLAEVEQGLIIRADSLDELADALGLPAAKLKQTVDRWNEDCRAGVDSQFARRSDILKSLDNPPYYAVTTRPMIGWTNGGPRRDHASWVIHAEGHVIPGLYAVGETSSTYSWSKDGGFHLADAMAFGRIAGAEASGRARVASEQPRATQRLG